jgi:superfamily I DNA/RNA helicase
VKEFESMLHQQGIPYYLMDGEKKIGNKNGIVVLTMHNLKGLEFKHVFLAQVNEDSAPLKVHSSYSSEHSEQQRLKSEKSLHYVAASRAIQTLSISGFGKPSPWFQGLLDT